MGNTGNTGQCMSRARAARARRPDRRGDSSVEVAVHMARTILPRCAQQQGGARGASRLDSAATEIYERGMP